MNKKSEMTDLSFMGKVFDWISEREFTMGEITSIRFPKGLSRMSDHVVLVDYTLLRKHKKMAILTWDYENDEIRAEHIDADIIEGYSQLKKLHPYITYRESAEVFGCSVSKINKTIFQ